MNDGQALWGMLRKYYPLQEMGMHADSESFRRNQCGCFFRGLAKQETIRLCTATEL